MYISVIGITHYYHYQHRLVMSDVLVTNIVKRVPIIEFHHNCFFKLKPEY